MTKLPYQKVMNFLLKWRIAPSQLIYQEALRSSLSANSFKDLLWRLREQNEVSTVRFHNERYHFHKSLEKRASALKKLSAQDRQKRFSSWGIDHHLKVVAVGIALEKLFPDFSIIANLFSDYVSFSVGSTTVSRKKYVPDLVVTGRSRGPEILSYIEVERSLKAKKRYDERWLSYENDPDLQICLYWAFDTSIYLRLRRWIERHMKHQYSSPHFRLGLIYHHDFMTNPHGAIVEIHSLEGKAPRTLKEALLGEDFSELTSSLPPFLNESDKSNQFDYLAIGAGLTPLPLPYHSTNVLKVADTTVRGVSPAPKSINQQNQ